jgi:hypothetical protein
VKRRFPPFHLSRDLPHHSFRLDRDLTDWDISCLPSHPLEKLVARKKRRGSEAVYEAKPPCSRSTRLVATLIQKVTDGSLLSPVSATVTICHSDYFIHKPFFLISIAVRSKKKSQGLHSRSGSFPPPSFLLPPSVKSSLPFFKMPDWSASANVQSVPLFG